MNTYVKSMNLSEVRVLFKHRVGMTKCAENYKGWKKYAAEKAYCRVCGKYDSQSHLLACPAFVHLRGPNICLQRDDDLVTYLREVLRLREEWEKQ